MRASSVIRGAVIEPTTTTSPGNSGSSMLNPNICLRLTQLYTQCPRPSLPFAHIHCSKHLSFFFSRMSCLLAEPLFIIFHAFGQCTRSHHVDALMRIPSTTFIRSHDDTFSLTSPQMLERACPMQPPSRCWSPWA